jgi:hypothetical protein
MTEFGYLKTEDDYEKFQEGKIFPSFGKKGATHTLLQFLERINFGNRF